MRFYVGEQCHQLCESFRDTLVKPQFGNKQRTKFRPAFPVNPMRQACPAKRTAEQSHQRHCAEAGRVRRVFWTHRAFWQSGDGTKSCRLRCQRWRGCNCGTLEIRRHGGSLRQPTGGSQRCHRQMPPKSGVVRQEVGEKKSYRATRKAFFSPARASEDKADARTTTSPSSSKTPCAARYCGPKFIV